MRDGPTLARVGGALYEFITSCGYLTSFDDWATKIAANPAYSACPGVDGACVKGTYPVSGGGCRCASLAGRAMRGTHSPSGDLSWTCCQGGPAFHHRPLQATLGGAMRVQACQLQSLLPHPG